MPCKSSIKSDTQSTIKLQQFVWKKSCRRRTSVNDKINVEFCEKHHKDIELVDIEAGALQNLLSIFSIVYRPVGLLVLMAWWQRQTGSAEVG